MPEEAPSALKEQLLKIVSSLDENQLRDITFGDICIEIKNKCAYRVRLIHSLLVKKDNEAG